MSDDYVETKPLFTLYLEGGAILSFRATNVVLHRTASQTVTSYEIGNPEGEVPVWIDPVRIIALTRQEP